MTELNSSAFQASPLQQWLWNRCAAGDPAPYTQLRVRVEQPSGDAGDRAVAEALGRLVQGHEILRTTLVAAPSGQAGQLIHDEGHPLATAQAATAAELAKLCRKEREGLDVVAGPGFRALLVTLGDGGRELILTAHAAIADAASLRLLCREL